jgi:hypothetical protein
MNCEWWTRRLPLENDRDVLARIGFRFIWATAPYFAVTDLLGIGPFGDHGQGFQRFVTAFIFAIPILGGALDWLRVHHRGRPDSAAYPTNTANGR